MAGGIFAPKKRTRTSTWEEKKIQALSYLETLQVTQGATDLAGLESDPTKEGGTTTPLPTAGEEALNMLHQSLTFGLGGHNVERETTIDTSGWKVKNRSFITKWDKARYAVGIKEIGAFSYRYSEKSGFVSVPYRTPKPISSVSLQADEIIPRAFTDNTPMKPWIRYWLSFNDNDTWLEIAPANQGAMARVDGERLPQVYHVNSGIPIQERDPRSGYVDFDVAVNQVRLKAILERPGNEADMTPVLKGYRLNLKVRGGL